MAEFKQKTNINNRGETGGFRGIGRIAARDLALVGYKPTGEQNTWGKISQWIPGIGAGFHASAERITQGSDINPEIKEHRKQLLKKQTLGIAAVLTAGFGGPLLAAGGGGATGTTSGAIGTTSGAIGTTSGATGTTSGAIGTTSGATGTTSGVAGTTSGVAGATSVSSNVANTAAATTEQTVTEQLTKAEQIKKAGELYDNYGNLIPKAKGFGGWLRRGIDPSGVNTSSEGMYASGQGAGGYGYT